MTPVVAVLLFQISAGAIVARVKQNDVRIEDLTATCRMEIVSAGETKDRVFELSLLRDGVDYRARIRLIEPASMAGTEFLIHASRGERNRQWAYFPDLDLVREIAGKSQDDPFLGSDITYADLAGGAHLDDLEHRLVGEEELSGDDVYVMEGVPKHRIAYGKLRGFIRMEDFVTVKAVFFDDEGRPIKEARISEVRDVGDGIPFGHRVEVESASGESRTVLSFTDVSVNQGLSEESFTEEALGK